MATVCASKLFALVSIGAALFGLSWPCLADQPEPVRSILELRHRNVVIQRWDLSCGAAALATILNFQHGDAVTEREIAIEMMGRDEYLANPAIVTYRKGFSLLDLKRFVDDRGYNGVGLGQLTLEHLLEYAPIIVPISAHGYQHFVVFRGVRGNRVLLADPAFGNRTMSLSRFQRNWLTFSDFGHIGFRVERTDGLIPPDRLALERADPAMPR
jgi:predicted double-glycine peptidase